MTHNELKDRLFNILNETNELPIADIDVNDDDSNFKIVLNDGSEFIISTQSYGKVFFII